MRALMRDLAFLVAAVAAMVTAIVGASPGIASASLAAHRAPRTAAPIAGGRGLTSAQAPAGLRAPGLTLAQAPAGLRAAVRKELGRRAPAADGSWSQQAALTDPAATANDLFGYSVAISGSTAVIGSVGANDYAGAAYVFVRSGTTWSVQQELTDPVTGYGGDFGSSVAIDESTLVVGADNVAIEDTGVAYVYARSGTTWSQQAELDDPLNADGDAFGSSVAISGSTVVIGAPGTDAAVVGNIGPGAAYVFAGSGGTWTQQAALSDPGGGTSDDFGGSVTISGSTAVIGADGVNSDSGAAYVFTGSGGTWTRQAELTDPPDAANDIFGNSVAISGSTVVVGAPYTPYPSDIGAAYVFTGSGSTWTEQAALTDPADTNYDEFGGSVAVSGSTAVVGARALGGTGNGTAYVFTGSGGTWTQQAALSDGVSYDNFGGTVAISGSTAVVGAYDANSSAGAAYLYVQPAPASPCGTLTTAPTYKHVIVIMDENHSYKQIIGSSSAPYINSLAKQCGLASEYHNITHDSLPNYLGITSGLPYSSLLPFDQDCLPSSFCEVTTNNIFHQASSWKEYAESMPSNCDQANAGDYAPRHNPSVYYTDLSNCATNDVPLGTTSSSPLLNDFSSESTAPAFAYVTGNLCDDMHGATGCKTGLVKKGDTWLSDWIPLITSTPVYQDGDTAIILVWDEGSGGTVGEQCYNNKTDQSCHVPAIVIAPSVKAGTVVSTQFDHYSMLKTTEQLLGLPQLGQAATATSMKSKFNL